MFTLHTQHLTKAKTGKFTHNKKTDSTIQINIVFKVKKE